MTAGPLTVVEDAAVVTAADLFTPAQLAALRAADYDVWFIPAERLLGVEPPS